MGVEYSPKVSIIIPVYNGSNYLRNAIDCALEQTYDNLEVIVVNDGSKDDGATERIALSYGDKIRYFSKENGGVSSALNYGISRMRGEYFSWLSHDDAYTPNKITDAIQTLISTGSMDQNTIAYTSGFYIDKDGKRVKPFSIHFVQGKVYSGKEMAEYSCEYGTLNGCCMLIPKNVFNVCGGFNEHLRYSQDSLMWMQMFLKGVSFVFDGKNNVMYRLHPAQVSQTRKDLFAKDAHTIAQILAPEFQKISTKHNNIMFKYALRMAQYRCISTVKTMQVYAKEIGRAHV